MKRIICFFVSVTITLSVLISLSSCQVSKDEIKPIDTVKLYYEYIESAPEGEYPKEERDLVILCPSPAPNEDARLEFDRNFTEVSNLVKAKYVCTKRTYPIYMHKFELTENLYGEGVPQTFYVSSDPSMYNYLYEIKYESEKEYLLLLIKERTPFVQEDTFNFADGYDVTVMPIAADGDVDFSAATWWSTPLIDKLSDGEFSDAAKNRTFVEKVLETVKTVHYPLDAHYFGNFIVSEDPEKILSDSWAVLHVSVDKCVNDKPEFNSDRYRCSVKEVLKGEAFENTLEIRLPSYAVNVGDEYVIAILESEHLWVSSRYSMYDIENIDAIKRLLKD